MFVSSLLFYYGLFLMSCGIVSVMLIGLKAKTALGSGGISGIVAITIGHFISQGSAAAKFAGLLVCSGLFIIFCWITDDMDGYVKFGQVSLAPGKLNSINS